MVVVCPGLGVGVAKGGDALGFEVHPTIANVIANAMTKKYEMVRSIGPKRIVNSLTLLEACLARRKA